MTANRTFRIGRAIVSVTLAVCLVVPVTAIGQSAEPRSPPAAKDRKTKDAGAGKADKSEPSRTTAPDTREKKPGDERIRLDAPVSFPVDI